MKVKNILLWIGLWFLFLIFLLWTSKLLFSGGIVPHPIENNNIRKNFEEIFFRMYKFDVYEIDSDRVEFEDYDILIGKSGTSKDIIVYDTTHSTQAWKIEVIAGTLTATKVTP